MIFPRVQAMIDNPGIYVIGDIVAPEMAFVVWSEGGKLTALSKDQELDPARFTVGMIVKHGPLK